MTETTDDARRALGIPDGARLVPLPGLRPVGSDAAEGRGATQVAVLTLAALVQGKLRENPTSFEELELPAQLADAGVVRARWSELAPVAQLAGPGLRDARSVGETFASGPDVWFLGTGAKAYLPGSGGRAGVVLSVGVDGIEVELVEDGGTGLAADWAMPEPLEVTAPSLADLLGEPGWEAGCAPWLEQEFAALVKTKAPMAVVAGVGLVGRLWMPQRRPADAEALLALGGTSRRARTWYAALEPATRARLEAGAIDAAHILHDDLKALPEALLETDDGARTMALGWVFRRDDLESLAFLGGTAALAAALAALDREALVHATVWSTLGAFPESERLGAVSWQEPEAWWGALALS
jgi:hypothetical protein